MTSCKPVSFSRRTLHHGVSKQVSIIRWLHLCDLRLLPRCEILLWDVMQSREVVNYRHFGATFRSHLQWLSNRDVRDQHCGHPRSICYFKSRRNIESDYGNILGRSKFVLCFFTSEYGPECCCEHHLTCQVSSLFRQSLTNYVSEQHYFAGQTGCNIHGIITSVLLARLHVQY